jgi:hypothetical protein
LYELRENKKGVALAELQCRRVVGVFQAGGRAVLPVFTILIIQATLFAELEDIAEAK